jgi:hypothetical protein
MEGSSAGFYYLVLRVERIEKRSSRPKHLFVVSPVTVALHPPSRSAAMSRLDSLLSTSIHQYTTYKQFVSSRLLEYCYLL